jgi:hypothetical protein
MLRISTLAAAACVLAANALAQTADCNRDWLRGFLTQYLNALVAHDPSALPLDPKVRFTEDTVERKLGEGFWKTASGIRPFRQDFLDVRQGVAAAHVVMEEAGNPVLFALRLKVAAGKITEVETQVTRGRADGALFNTDTLQAASPAMAVVPTAAQRASREEAIRIADYYPRGLTIGSFVTVDAPFAPDAYRYENGGKMAGPGCARAGCENIKTQRIIAHPALTSRVMAVDEELGIVLLWMNFGDTNSYGPGNALIVWEAFKVYGGQIHAVEAFMKVMPATTKRGWE